MECNGTFIEKRRWRKGFTLVELMVSTAIGSVAFAALTHLTFYTGRSFAAITNYVDLDRHSRNALDQLSLKIRQADELLAYSTNRLEFSYQKTNTLVYLYSPGAKTLTETIGSTSTVLLKECNELTFSIFQRNTASGTYDQFPATLTNSAAKLVQVSWTCSRSILGAQLNTESVQSAKIVIRNQ
jgi:prepilin-type N-terminal cleavage/methylation domain-containing protein